MSVNTLRGQQNPTPEGEYGEYINLLGNKGEIAPGRSGEDLIGIYNVYKIGNAHTASLLQGSIGDVNLEINSLETFVNLVASYDLKLLIFADNTNIKSDRTTITIDRT